MIDDELDDLAARLDALVDAGDLATLSAALPPMPPQDIAAALERLPERSLAVAFRLLSKDRAVAVFDRLDAAVQRELVSVLAEEDVARVFDALDPDDRVELIDELPASVAHRLVRALSPAERDATAVVLGYPQGSIGRRMSPEVLHVFLGERVEQALERIRERGSESETIYTLPVVDQDRAVVGVVSLRDLFLAPPDDLIADHAAPPIFAVADEDEEQAARRCLDRELLAMPVVDREERLVGLLTVDDAARIVESARDEDAARAGGAEPLRRPYLQTPVRTITRSRIVWLFVLAVSGMLTVNVLELFEATLEQRVALSLFIPLLTGIGGNTGSQAATTLTRALAMGEARPRDIGRVALKEARTGLTMGILLGAAGFAVGGLVYDVGIGTVIGLTLVGICTMAATVGGGMPLLARAIRVDPAVFSTPFITTFCDATGLLIYFSIARAVLGL